MAGNQVSSKSAASPLTIKTNIQDVTSITLSSTTKSVTRGASDTTFTLTATINPSNTDSSKRTLTWASSNTSVATVDQAGKVTVKAKGTANITATSSNGKVGTCALTVTQAVTGLSISPTTKEINIGDTFTITPTISPSAPSTTGVTYSSSNTGIATVTSAGVVKGIAAGTSTITVTTKGTNTVGSKISKTCSVTIISSSAKLTSSKLYTSNCGGTGISWGAYTNGSLTTAMSTNSGFRTDYFTIDKQVSSVVRVASNTSGWPSWGEYTGSVYVGWANNYVLGGNDSNGYWRIEYKCTDGSTFVLRGRTTDWGNNTVTDVSIE